MRCDSWTAFPSPTSEAEYSPPELTSTNEDKPPDSALLFRIKQKMKNKLGLGTEDAIKSVGAPRGLHHVSVHRQHTTMLQQLNNV
jgi:hypothetical protein